MNVKWFILGIIATLIALSAATYVYLEKGFVSIRADVKPGALDDWLGSAMDASTKRNAPKMMNPVPDTPDALLASAKLYGSSCGICHGSPAEKNSKIGEAFSPPAPQFFGDDPPAMKENENFYIIKHGVRMTAMPAWGNLLSDQQTWQAVNLLKHINDKDLSPAITEELNKQEGAQH